jgi:beta-N-acetylhexosaminidase
LLTCCTAAEQTTQLVLDLQNIAHDAGHPVPLAIAIDQENGGVNSLYDEIYIRQFPSAMGLAATGSKELANDVATATGQELNSVGVNWILGPVLDVLTNVRNQPLGVRAIGDDPQEVSNYGAEFIKGYQKAGVVTCGKHFPSYGNLEFFGAPTDVPIITDSLEQLSQSALVPFRNAVIQGLDAMMVGGVAMSSGNMNVMHACLSERIVEELLRRDLHFNGVVVSECLEMEALSHNIGVGGGTVMAVKAGCDVVLLCRSFSVQQEAIGGLKLGVENGTIERSRIVQSLTRVLAMKSKCTSWDKALKPGGVVSLAKLLPQHSALSTTAYNESITVVRDQKQYLPLTKTIDQHEELLLLTPLLKPLPTSAAFKTLGETNDAPSHEHHSAWEASASVMSGERVFRELGRSLARQRKGRLLHASYTANGLRPDHESLINRASAVIVVTANAGQNRYQHAFTKHVAMLCKSATTNVGDHKEKPCIVIAVSSPSDFATDSSIGTYICTFDFTETAQQALVKVLYGELTPNGGLPGTMRQSQRTNQTRQHWLVENFNEERDALPLDMLLETIQGDQSQETSALVGASSDTFLLHTSHVDEAHFVVRNSSTKELYGFCSTYYFRSVGIGVIGSIIVDPSRRNLSIGHSLHSRAIRSLLQKKGVKKVQLGSRLPSIYLGIPSDDPLHRKRLRKWFANMGWNVSVSRPVCTMILRDLSSWRPPEGLGHTLSNPDVKYDLVTGTEYVEAMIDHIKPNSRQGALEVYQLALADKANCGVIRAKRAEDGSILGSVIIYKGGSKLSGFVPVLADQWFAAGGISSLIVSKSVAESTSLIQGLILLGIRQIKKQGSAMVILDNVRLF